jgi:hypothetical protein
LKTIARILAAVTLVVLSAAARSAEPSHVIMDPSDQHTTTFVSVPKTMPANDFENLKSSLAQRKGAVLMAWQEFKEAPEKFIRPRIRRNDYTDVDVVGGLVQLLERYQGNPFGLTWNGGLAVTQNDYRHSARTFSVYLDRGLDPVHPQNHLGPLLRK